MRPALAASVLLLCGTVVQAQPAPGFALLQRMQQAAQQLNYVGLFTYQHGSHLVASQIVHQAAGAGGSVRERIELLDGPKQREFLREGKTVLSLLPEVPLVLVEQRETEHFPGLITGDPRRLTDWYGVQMLPDPGRVAGRACTQAELQPRDAWRWGYRLCVDDEHGLLLKVQTLDAEGDILEQAAFSELAIEAQVDPQLLASRHDWHEWRRVQGGHQASLAAAGWQVQAPPGFAPVSEVVRKIKGRAKVHQMVLTDGLSAISVFIEPYDPTLGVAESVGGYGATSIYRGRKNDSWVTVLGEVPPQTVRAVADSLDP